MDRIGLSSDRFVDEDVDHFLCIICSDMVLNPKMCQKCQHIFCSKCIDEWVKSNKFCPFKCSNKEEMKFIKLPCSVAKMYESLLVTCSKAECQAIIALKDLFHHENSCGAMKCLNHEKCQKDAPLLILDKRVCSEKCYIAMSFKNGEEIEDQILYKLIRNFIERINSDLGKIRTFHCFWQEPEDDNKMIEAKKEEIEEEKKKGLKVNFREAMVTNDSDAENKCYKSAVGAYAIMGGAQYFEINIKNGSKGFKVGVTKNPKTDLDKSFCDFDSGYAYFSKGQLRHNSDSMGMKYGEKCKGNFSTIGVFINTNRGQIGFSVNGKFSGVAFEGDEFREGPFYPAVALREGVSAVFVNQIANPDEIIFS